MPYPNFHSARVKDPDSFDRIVVLKTLDNGIMIYGGPLKSDPKGPGVTQAYRFPKDKFTVEEAKKWLKDHDIKYILFEPATGKEEDGEMQRLEMKFVCESVKSSDEEDYYIIEGYGSIFGNVDLGDDVVEKGAFTDSLKSRLPKMLWHHDTRKPVGVWTEATENEKGLWLRGKLPKGNTDSKNCAELAKCGALGGLSIGYSVPKDGFDIRNGIRYLKKLDCFEVSFVTFPMNPKAEISSCKEIDELVDMKDVNEYLKSRGFTNRERNYLVTKIKEISLAESKLETPPEGAAENDVQPELAEELKRLSKNLAGN